MTVKKKKKFSGKAKKFIFLLTALIISAIMFLELRICPIVRQTAGIQSKALAVLAINQTVNDIIEEMNITCEELETVSADENGRVTSISTNTVNTNKLKNIITVRVQEQIGNIKNREIDIPLGTIIGGEIFSGQGVEIPVYISMTGNVESDFESEFESGGINQTVHKLSVRISADITVIIPFSTVNETVCTTVLIGETLIVGTTPSGMIVRDN